MPVLRSDTGAVVSARRSTFQLSVTLKIRAVSLLQRVHVQSFTSEPRKAWGVGLKSALICFWSSLTVGSARALGQQFYASLSCRRLLLNSRIIKYLFANRNVKKYNKAKHICPWRLDPNFPKGTCAQSCLSTYIWYTRF